VLHLSGYSDWLLEAFGSVWTHTDDGHLLRLDPTSGAVLASFETGWHELPACQGLGHDAAQLWTCRDAGHLTRIDPVNGHGTRVALAKRSDEGRLAWSGGLEWVIESGTTDLVGLDARGSVAARVPLGTVCTDLAYGDEVVFAVCPSAGEVVKVDTVAREVAGTIAVTDPRTAALGQDLFVGSAGSLTQIDPATLAVIHTYTDVGAGLDGAIAATPTEVWVRSSGPHFLTKVDPRAHRVVATLDTDDYPSGGDVLITHNWVWASAYDDGVVVRVARDEAAS